jgi:branched-chain amino acid transport system substrate-binding protein
MVGVVSLAVLSALAVAGRSDERTLPPSFCSKVSFGGPGSPDYLIVSDLAEQNRSAVVLQMIAAIKFVLAQHHFQAGHYSIGYQACDDSTPQNLSGDFAKCAANAKAYAADASVIGVIGAWKSSCSSVELPILGNTPTGLLALISPTNTAPGLTHSSGGSAPGEPARYYPSGKRNFVRLVGPDDFQGAAAAQLATQLGLHRVFVLDDAETYGLDVAGGFKNAAGHLHLPLAGSGSWNISQTNFEALANRVARAHPDGVLLAGLACPGCGALINSLRSRLPSARLISDDGFGPGAFLAKAVGAGAEGILLTEPGLPPGRFGPLGRKLEQRFGKTFVFEDGGAPVAAQAAEVLLDAIAQSDGTRSSVTAHLLADRVHGGILGYFKFDRYGDMTPSPVTISRIEHGQGVVDRVILVPSQLLH